MHGKDGVVSLLIKEIKVEGRSLHGGGNQDVVTYVWSSTKKWDTESYKKQAYI